MIVKQSPEPRKNQQRFIQMRAKRARTKSRLTESGCASAGRTDHRWWQREMPSTLGHSVTSSNEVEQKKDRGKRNATLASMIVIAKRMCLSVIFVKSHCFALFTYLLDAMWMFGMARYLLR